jgi:hypothetical protein
MENPKRAYVKLEVSLYGLDPEKRKPSDEAGLVRSLLVDALLPEMDADVEVVLVESAGYAE